MKMNSIHARAKAVGLTRTVGMKKVVLIRAIQVTEGNTPCFQARDSACDQTLCAWRDDCLPGGRNVVNSGSADSEFRGEK